MNGYDAIRTLRTRLHPKQYRPHRLPITGNAVTSSSLASHSHYSHSPRGGLISFWMDTVLFATFTLLSILWARVLTGSSPRGVPSLSPLLWRDIIVITTSARSSIAWLPLPPPLPPALSPADPSPRSSSPPLPPPFPDDAIVAEPPWWRNRHCFPQLHCSHYPYCNPASLMDLALITPSHSIPFYRLPS